MATTGRDADTDTRTRLLDAAERILVTEGYPAVTSRRVEQAAGLKSKLVHYHFQTMDELFVAIFRRRGDEGIQRFRDAMTTDLSIREIWDFSLDPIGYNLEFAVIAKHRPAIRDEIVAIASRFRALQIEALTNALDRHGQRSETFTPEFLVLAMNGLSQILAMEDNLGVTAGHHGAEVTIERLLDRFS